MGRKSRVYTLKDALKSKIQNNCDVILNHEKSVSLIDELEQVEFESIYFVGCEFGQFLINIKRAFPDVEVGGCEVGEIYRSFAEQEFEISLENVNFEIKEPPYHPIPKADIIVVDDYLKDCSDKDVCLTMIFANAQKYVIMFNDYKTKIAEMGDYKNLDNNMELDIFEIPKVDPVAEVKKGAVKSLADQLGIKNKPTEDLIWGKDETKTDRN